jgi:hypothetical protein
MMHPLDRTIVRYSDVVLPLPYKTQANFNELAPGLRLPYATISAITASSIAQNSAFVTQLVLQSVW